MTRLNEKQKKEILAAKLAKEKLENRQKEIIL